MYKHEACLNFGQGVGRKRIKISYEVLSIVDEILEEKRSRIHGSGGFPRRSWRKNGKNPQLSGFFESKCREKNLLKLRAQDPQKSLF